MVYSEASGTEIYLELWKGQLWEGQLELQLVKKEQMLEKDLVH